MSWFLSIEILIINVLILCLGAPFFTSVMHECIWRTMYRRNDITGIERTLYRRNDITGNNESIIMIYTSHNILVLTSYDNSFSNNSVLLI